MKRAVIFSLILALSTIGYADTIYVPDDHGTIQGAIDAAANGDMIIVRPDTYVENIDFLGKAITVKSELGPEVTIIDGSDPVNPDFGSVVTIMSGEGLDSVLDGFTLSNGTGCYNPDLDTFRGGGIAIELSSPTIVNNIINENTAEVGAGIICDISSSPVISNNTFTANAASITGGGIFCRDGSSPLITDNTFTANSAAENGGGGIGCYIFSSPTITNNVFTENVSTGGGFPSGGAVGCVGFCEPAISNNVFYLNSATDDGGALMIWWFCDATIENNLITNNSAGDFGGGICSDNAILTLANNTITGNSAVVGGGGIGLLNSSAATISNTIFWDNAAPGGSEGYLGGTDTLTISYSDADGGEGSIELIPGATLNWGAGMIDEDPLFVTGPDSDYYLSQVVAGQTENSPCVEAGDPASEMIEGTTRTDEVQDAGVVDIGFHYPPTSCDLTLDIKPGSCPNSFNPRSKGVLPVALVGTELFDIMNVDVASVELSRADGVGGYAVPNEGPPGPHSTYEDVATPFCGELCGCHEMEGDGITDLNMKFKSAEVAEALELGSLAFSEEVELVVSGTLLDGTPFTESDCIRVVGKARGMSTGDDRRIK